MNKTVSINLAGSFFHIDENAYLKLSRYLNSVKSSLRDSSGSEEILRDIELRIAELFSERINPKNQVVTLEEVERIIAVMGQPEDYVIDDEYYEETESDPEADSSAKKSGYRKLFRDIDHKYIGGVSSGLGHYFGIDVVWIRLIWVLLLLAGVGSPVLIYILLWIFVPAAVTTSEKLQMTGEPINISNIERKFKEGYNKVADSVKNVDYDKYSNKIKKGASGFFDVLAEIFTAAFKISIKIIGGIIMLISLIVIFGLLISYLSFGGINFLGVQGWTEYTETWITMGMPMWLVSLLLLFSVGIPFFILFYLGLKLLISHIKPLGSTFKILLTVVWVLSVMGLGFIAVRQGLEDAHQGNFIDEKTFQIQKNDTLRLRMAADTEFENKTGRNRSLKIKYTDRNIPVIYSRNIDLRIKPAAGPEGKIRINKSASGNTPLQAKKRAEAIAYHFSAEDTDLVADGYFTTDRSNKFRDQKVQITIEIPEGVYFEPHINTSSYYVFDSMMSQFQEWRKEKHNYLITEKGLECTDCKAKNQEAEAEEAVEKTEENSTPDEAASWEKQMEEEFSKQNK